MSLLNSIIFFTLAIFPISFAAECNCGDDTITIQKYDSCKINITQPTDECSMTVDLKDLFKIFHFKTAIFILLKSCENCKNKL